MVIALIALFPIVAIVTSSMTRAMFSTPLGPMASMMILHSVAMTDPIE
jgi:hypothetical protein